MRAVRENARRAPENRNVMQNIMSIQISGLSSDSIPALVTARTVAVDTLEPEIGDAGMQCDSIRSVVDAVA